MIIFERLESGIAPVEVNMPTYGYKIQIHMALVIDRFRRRVDSHDRGVEHDYRIAEYKLNLPEEQMLALKSVLTSRVGNDWLWMSLPKGNFTIGLEEGILGPDLWGMYSFEVPFKVSILNKDFSAMKVSPFGFFDVPIRVYLGQGSSPPLTAPIPAEQDAAWDFGDILGLRQPAVINPKSEHSEAKTVGAAGGVSYVQSLTDEFTSQITIRATTNKMAELLCYITRVVRGNTIEVDTGKNFWLFGGSQKKQGIIPVRLLNNVLTLTHENPNMWVVELTLWNAEKMQ